MPLSPLVHRAAPKVLAPALAMALALVLAACDTTAPTGPPTAAPSPTARPAAEIYAAIQGAVEAIRGFDPTAAVAPVAIDEAQLRKNIETEFDAAQTPEQLKDTEDLLITLGLLPEGASLRAMTLDFQAGQIAGYYDPAKNELYVISRTGGLGPVEEVTYAHEFTHQLQDQNVDLDAFDLDALDQSDRALAARALIEGDATSVQSTWMLANLDSRELGEVLAAGLDPAAIEALRKAPRYLRETTTFQYEDGLAFITRLMADGDYAAVNAAYADPPTSTEQILHPDKYLLREPPIEVDFADDFAAVLGTGGWKEAGRDTLGELTLRIWLRENGLTLAEARTATAGWGGDRVMLLRGPNATGVVLDTRWDTPDDANEFAAAARTAVGQLAADGKVFHIAGTSAVFVAIGAVADLLPVVV